MTSSMIAALNTLTPMKDFNFPKSHRVITVTLTLVAVKIAPVKQQLPGLWPLK